MHDKIRDWIIKNGRRFVELKLLSNMESSDSRIIIVDKDRKCYSITDSEWSDLMMLIGQIDALTWAFHEPDLIIELNNFLMLLEVEVASLQEQFESKRILRGIA